MTSETSTTRSDTDLGYARQARWAGRAVIAGIALVVALPLSGWFAYDHLFQPSESEMLAEMREWGAPGVNSIDFRGWWFLDRELVIDMGATATPTDAVRACNAAQNAGWADDIRVIDEDRLMAGLSDSGACVPG